MGSSRVPREDTCYLVIPAKGVKSFSRATREGLEEADHYAAKMARSTEEPYAILVVPSDFLDSARVARFHGVVFDILYLSDMENED